MVIYKTLFQLFYVMKSKAKKGNVFVLIDSEEKLKKLGDRIKSLRIAKGYTNYEHFAYEHNISRAQYGRYENGQDIRFSSLIKLMNAFEMTVSEFFSEGFD